MIKRKKYFRCDGCGEDVHDIPHRDYDENNRPEPGIRLCSDCKYGEALNRYRISYYYLATGMEGRADEFPEKEIEAENKDKAIWMYLKDNGFEVGSFSAWILKDKYEREWGITCDLIG